MPDLKNSIEAWIALRGSSVAQLRRTLLIGDAHITQDAAYGKLKGLTMMHNPAVSPVKAYFSDDELVLLYVHAPDPLEIKKLQDRLGQPDHTLRSRAGKRFTHHIYTRQGIAFSLERSGQNAKILEIFTPDISLETYRATYYVEPGDFSK